MHIIIRVQCHLKSKESSDNYDMPGDGVKEGRGWGEGGYGVGEGRGWGEGGCGVKEGRGGAREGAG